MPTALGSRRTCCCGLNAQPIASDTAFCMYGLLVWQDHGRSTGAGNNTPGQAPGMHCCLIKSIPQGILRSLEGLCGSQYAHAKALHAVKQSKPQAEPARSVLHRLLSVWFAPKTAPSLVQGSTHRQHSFSPNTAQLDDVQQVAPRSSAQVLHLTAPLQAPCMQPGTTQAPGTA